MSSGVAHHFAPCRNCGAFTVESTMTRVSRVLPTTKKGFLCQPCVTVVTQRGYLSRFQ